ncbi:tautomerase family protein [Pseudomonas gelidaquae]|uniref:tautomerase family protein n=1 Tax=Pseudomonas sp. IB20 TaxID=1702250 RepID=UPI0012D317F1|nr:4-oxalocrotonate tautomerase family protein [Pseudomonas sp. IB20]
MPFVSLRITRDGVTPEQKAQVIAEFTETLERVLNKRPDLTHIVIEEVDTDNWGLESPPWYGWLPGLRAAVC